MKLWHVPIRLATGAYILNSGLSKRAMGQEAAQGLHGFAASAHPELADMEPKSFANLLSKSEITLGAALLLPVVPSWLAGLGLIGFSGGLMRLYMNAPGQREDGSIKPTAQGSAIAKDSWMLGIGLALLIDALNPRS